MKIDRKEVSFCNSIELIKSERDDSNSVGSGRELGHGLGTFTDGMLGELTWQEESDGGLDLAG